MGAFQVRIFCDSKNGNDAWGPSSFLLHDRGRAGCSIRTADPTCTMFPLDSEKMGRIYYSGLTKKIPVFCCTVQHISLTTHLLNYRQEQLGFVDANQQKAFLEDANTYMRSLVSAETSGRFLLHFVIRQKFLPSSVSCKKRSPTWIVRAPCEEYLQWDHLGSALILTASWLYF